MTEVFSSSCPPPQLAVLSCLNCRCGAWVLIDYKWHRVGSSYITTLTWAVALSTRYPRAKLRHRLRLWWFRTVAVRLPTESLA